MEFQLLAGVQNWRGHATRKGQQPQRSFSCMWGYCVYQENHTAQSQLYHQLIRGKPKAGTEIWVEELSGISALPTTAPKTRLLTSPWRNFSTHMFLRGVYESGHQKES